MFVGIQEMLVLLTIVLLLVLVHKFFVKNSVIPVRGKYIVSKKIKLLSILSFLWFILGCGIFLHRLDGKYSTFIFIILLPVFILWGILWICNNKK